ncbi:MAG: hypothetical protein ACOCX2_08280, partial [Armatimonadota bacterium]
MQATREGNVFTLEWTGPANEGDRLTFFSLIGRDITGDDEELACMRLSDGAAAIALPEPAIAVSGEYEGTVADLAIVASDHLYARDATEAAAGAPLLSASDPVTLNWDFEAGTLSVLADTESRLLLPVTDVDAMTMNGEPVECAPAGDLMAFAIPAGEHTLGGLRPSEDA